MGCQFGVPGGTYPPEKYPRAPPGPLGLEQKKCGLRRGVYFREIKNAVLIFYITAHQVKPQLAMFVIRATRKTYLVFA